MTQAENSSGLGDQVRRGREEARAIGEEFSGIAEDLRDLARTEVELAKAELREQASAGIRLAAWGGIAAVLAVVGVVFAFLALMFGLDTAMPLWGAALITTGVALGLAAIAGLVAYRRLKRITVVPRKTMSSVKEDVQWAKEQLKSSASWSTNGAR